MKEQVTAKLRHLRMSPRKVRLLIGLIRGLKVDEAVSQLENNQKHASRPVLKLLLSAVANARENNNLKEETLVVKTAFVDEAPALHRWMPRAMGSASPLKKRGSHVTVVLEGEANEGKKVKKENKKVAKEDKKEDKAVKNEEKVDKKTENK
ncbi:MAG TPA: 50S ribosomal protein L22 [Candidatus Magasanikbacteria bacterium]|nr:50S ribosomal protein L22 [Candidatus Magasanikbacteria bacterium]